MPYYQVYPLVSILPLHQVLICRTHALLQLRRFWNLLRTKLTNKGSYLASIGSMKLRLQELQETDFKAQKLREQGRESYKKVNGVLHHQGLPFVPKAIRIELISRHHDDPLAGHFGIEKTCKLLARKYFWPSPWHDAEVYVKGCDVCLASQAVRHKPYDDHQSLPIPSHWWKDLLMDFVIGLPISTDWKRDSYDSILVIVDWLTKMVYYEPVKITINTWGLTEVIINVVVCHHCLPDSIVTDKGSLFTSKFWLSLC